MDRLFIDKIEISIFLVHLKNLLLNLPFTNIFYLISSGSVSVKIDM